jgi:hypothetical protein
MPNKDPNEPDSQKPHVVDEEEKDYRYHLEHSDVAKNYSDTELVVLKKDYAVIKEQVHSISDGLKKREVNMDIIDTYRQKKKEFKTKEADLQTLMDEH